MSLWQRKNQHKRYLLWLKLYGVCFLFHCIILLWVFFIHDNRLHHVALSLHKNIDYSAPILFVPVSQHVAMQHTQTPQITNTVVSPKKETPLVTKQTTVLHTKKENLASVAEKKEPEQEKKVVAPKLLEPKPAPSIAAMQQKQKDSPVAKKQSVPAIQTKNIITKNA